MGPLKTKLFNELRIESMKLRQWFRRLCLMLLTRLRLGLSHLNDYKFNHNFRDCVNPLCSYSLSVENNVHFFLHCHHFSLQRQTLMNNIKSVH